MKRYAIRTAAPGTGLAGIDPGVVGRDRRAATVRDGSVADGYRHGDVGRVVS